MTTTLGEGLGGVVVEGTGATGDCPQALVAVTIAADARPQAAIA
jgi:hypothetical protein